MMKQFVICICTDLHSRISIIIQRDKSAKYSQNRFDKSRRWGLDEVETVKTVMTSVLREAESRDDIGPIVVFSDADVDIMECIPCQIRLFSVAKLVIGVQHLMMPVLIICNMIFDPLFS